MRGIAKGRGRYNIPNVGLFLYRLQALSLTRSPAVPFSPGDQQRFLFSPLGIDLPLFNSPLTETEVTHLAEPINVPDRIKRRAMKIDFAAYYGRTRACCSNLPIRILFNRRSSRRVRNNKPHIIVCNLTDWTNQPTDVIAIDRSWGASLFRKHKTDQVLVSFHSASVPTWAAGNTTGSVRLIRASQRCSTTTADRIVNKVSNTLL